MQIEVVSRNLIKVHDVIVDYDQTPAEAIKGLPYNNPLIATSYPQGLWNGGKTGRVEGVTIPVCAPSRWFSTEDERKFQQEIGFGNPAELAALKREDVHQTLSAEGIWWVVSLRENDEDLWLAPDGGRRPVFIDLYPRYRGFRLGCAYYAWNVLRALVGSPQV